MTTNAGQSSVIVIYMTALAQTWRIKSKQRDCHGEQGSRLSTSTNRLVRM